MQVSREKIISKGIDVDSVQSRVVNLARLDPGITIKEMAEGLKRSFAAVYGDFSGISPLGVCSTSGASGFLLKLA